MVRIFNQYVSAKSLLFLFIEGWLMVFSIVIAARLRFWNDPESFADYVQLPNFGVQALVAVVILEICFYYSDLYNIAALRRRYERLVCLGQAAGAACLLLSPVYYLFPSLIIGRGVLFIAIVIMTVLILSFRIAVDHAWKLAAPKERILILGSQSLAGTVEKQLVDRNDLNLELAGYVSASTNGHKSQLVCPSLGSPDELETIAAEHRIQRIIVALEDQRGQLPIRELVRLRTQGIRVEDAHSIISALTGRVWLHTVKPSWFVFSGGFHRSGPTLVLKRVFDLALGVIGMILASPIMIFAAIAIRLESKGPVIYRQERVGLGSRTFNVMKFRSMRTDAEVGKGAQWAQKNDPRVTRIGKYLRKFRIDELPQFINVIRGDMSFVGPRPERPVFVDQLREKIAYYDDRHSVRPGLTGWAQVMYPYGSSEEDAFRKLEYDLFYLKNMSATFDLAIIVQTVRTVMSGNGAR